MSVLCEDQPSNYYTCGKGPACASLLGIQQDTDLKKFLEASLDRFANNADTDKTARAESILVVNA